MNDPLIMVIDDESQIRRLLEITLGSNGYRVAEAATAKEGLAMAASCQPDLVLLDLGLPDIDGQEALIQLRQWFSRPVIILSVKSAEAEIVRALDNGANDYLTKPFRTQELLARIRTALRQSDGAHDRHLVVFGNASIDIAARSVTMNGSLVRLTATEFNLLALLVRHEGSVLTHSFLLREIWGSSYVEQTQYLRVFMAQLRKKIEADANRPKYLITESGVGYRFSSG